MAKGRNHQNRSNVVTTPFDNQAEGTVAVAEPEAAATTDNGAELAEVDTPEALEDETDAPDPNTASSDKASAKADKPAKDKKPPRLTAPEGFVFPVAMAKLLTAHLEKKGASNKAGPITTKSATQAGNEIPPQQMYSMLKSSGAGSKNPIPTYVLAKDGQIFKTGEAPEGTLIERDNLLKPDEFIEWWDAKDARVAAAATARAEKASKAAEKAKAADAAPTETPSEPVVEAE